MRKLNIGCGIKKVEGYEGFDIQNFGQPHIGNIISYNFTSETFDEIRAEHFLEHFNQDDLRLILHKVHEWLRKDGIFEVIVPSKEKDEAYVLTHKTFWTEETFKAFENPTFKYEFEVNPHSKASSWKILELRTNEREDIYCKMQKINN